MTLRLFLFLFSFLSAVCAGGPFAAAQDLQRAEHVIVELLPPAGPVTAGAPFMAGIKLTPDEGWHVYWQNPGDSGLATQVTWQGADSAGATLYPLPDAIELPPMTNYGYHTPVTLLTPLVLPQQSTAPAMLTATVSFLMCKDVCIPGEVTLSRPLSVSPAASVPVGSPSLLPQDATVRAEHYPSPAPFEHTATCSAPARTCTLTFNLEKPFQGDVRFFPSQDGYLQDAAPQALRLAPSIGGGTSASYTYVLQLKLDPEAPAEHMDRAAAHPTDVLRGVLVLTPRTDAASQEGQPSLSVGYALFLSTTEHSNASHVFASFFGATDVASVSSETSLADIGSVGVPTSLSLEAAERAPFAEAPSFFWVLGAAFLGGLLLNLMPCVFPVLSLKIMALLHHRKHEAPLRFGLAYMAGVLATFLGLALLIYLLRLQGEAVGWGFHLQSPSFVAFLCLLMVLISANLFGLFEVGTSLTRLGRLVPSHDSLWSSFLSGSLITLVATPCTMPFMAGATAYALTQPFAIMLAVFGVLGLGLSVPYVLLTAYPAALRRLPKPGPWEETLRKVFGVPMALTALWLGWVFASQTAEAHHGALLLLAAVSLLTVGAAWGTRHFGAFTRTPWQRRSAWAVLWVVFVGGWAAVSFMVQQPSPAAARAVDMPAPQTPLGTTWLPWSDAAVTEARLHGTPVLVDFTADWCVSCQFNEKTVLESAEMRALFGAQGVALFKADWTSRDDAITQALKGHGRTGVPLYLYYAVSATEPVVLPQILTKGVLRSALR